MSDLPYITQNAGSDLFKKNLFFTSEVTSYFIFNHPTNMKFKFLPIIAKINAPNDSVSAALAKGDNPHGRVSSLHRIRPERMARQTAEIL